MKENEIVNRIKSINKNYLPEDTSSIPTDPQDFLDWWWDQARVCQECPLVENRNSVVKPDGIASARIMIIGEGPGFLEDLTEIPLVGPLELKHSKCNTCVKVTSCFSSRLLKTPYSYGKKAISVTCNRVPSNNEMLVGNAYLRSTGAIFDGILIKKWKYAFPRHNWVTKYNELHSDEPWKHESPWFITNAVMCRSTDSSKLRDMSPDSLPIQKCRKWLTYQWAAVNPDIIVCFGRVALKVLMKSTDAANSVFPNSIIETKFGPVIFQNHPAYFMREKNQTVRAYGYAKIQSTLEEALKYAKYIT